MPPAIKDDDRFILLVFMHHRACRCAQREGGVILRSHSFHITKKDRIKEFRQNNNRSTMNTALPIILRRTGLVASRGASPHCLTMLKAMSSESDEGKKVLEFDGHLQYEQMRVLQESMPALANRIESLETELADLKAQMAEAQKVFAVDAPDGDSDAHKIEEQDEVNHIIDDAAVIEDKDEIEAKHKLQDDVKKYHARDPEHDW